MDNQSSRTSEFDFAEMLEENEGSDGAKSPVSCRIFFFAFLLCIVFEFSKQWRKVPSSESDNSRAD